jgi:hypothetical protein
LGGKELSNFASSKRVIDNSTGHKEFFEGRTAACLSCSQRYDLPDLIMHVQEDHTIADITEAVVEASFYIDDLEMKKTMRYKK